MSAFHNPRHRQRFRSPRKPAVTRDERTSASGRLSTSSERPCMGAKLPLAGGSADCRSERTTVRISRREEIRFGVAEPTIAGREPVRTLPRRDAAVGSTRMACPKPRCSVRAGRRTQGVLCGTRYDRWRRPPPCSWVQSADAARFASLITRGAPALLHPFSRNLRFLCCPTKWPRSTNFSERRSRNFLEK